MKNPIKGGSKPSRGVLESSPKYLVYSSYDNGYYWQRWSDHACSLVYDTRLEANEADKNNEIEWEND